MVRRPTTAGEGAIHPLIRRARGAAVSLSLALTTAALPVAAVMPPKAAGRPGSCRLPSVSGVTMSEGFPVDHRVSTPATGRIRALTLFVDFPDAKAEASPRQRYDEFFPEVRKWFAVSSYGKLRYQPAPVLRYFRLPKRFSDYGIVRGYGWHVHQEMMRDLLKVADREVDFRGYDLVNVLVTPNAGPPASDTVLSVTWTGARAAVSDEGAPLDKVSVIYGHDAAGYRVLNHENLHVFGLPDLYSGSDFRLTDRWAGQWDLMSLDWGMHGDLLAWHKWRLGWISDSQVDCVLTRGTTDHTLSPVEVSGGRKMIVVPDGEAGAFALEVRSRRGNDRGGCGTGVLLYRVRTDIPSGQGPVRVVDSRPATAACRHSSNTFNSRNDAPFQVGGVYRDDATRTTVRITGRDARDRYTIRVTRD